MRLTIAGVGLARVDSLPIGGYNRVAVLAEPGAFSVTGQWAGSLSPATSVGQAFWSYLDEPSSIYRFSQIETFRGVRKYFIFIGVKQTGSTPANTFALPPIAAPFFVPSVLEF